MSDTTNIAPYWRFRTSWYYGTFYPNGSYTGDIMGCNWTCEHCWSKFGWKNVPARPKLGQVTPEEAATKLIEGMKRNGNTVSRISGGEPGMYWTSRNTHVPELIHEFIERTEGVRMRVGLTTALRGEPPGIIIETNGALLTPKHLDDLEASLGKEAARVVICIGAKATTPEGLSQLTGLPLSVAERAHERQLENLMHMVHNCEHLVAHAAFIDKYTDEGMFAELQREVERAHPGAGRRIVLVPWKRFGNANRFYTPRRLREKTFPDAIAEDDEEAALEFMGEDGAELEGHPPVKRETGTERRRFSRSVEKAQLPEGQMRS